MLGFVPQPNLQDRRSHLFYCRLGFVPQPNLQTTDVLLRSASGLALVGCEARQRNTPNITLKVVRGARIVNFGFLSKIIAANTHPTLVGAPPKADLFEIALYRPVFW
jgi:hypothetical protein